MFAPEIMHTAIRRRQRDITRRVLVAAAVVVMVEAAVLEVNLVVCYIETVVPEADTQHCTVQFPAVRPATVLAGSI